MCFVSVPPVLLAPLVNATHGLARIVPVAGVAGFPETVYVNCVEFFTVIVAVTLYCDCFAPETAICSPVKRVAVDTTVTVAVVPLLVNDVIDIVPGTVGAAPNVRVLYGSGVIIPVLTPCVKVQLFFGHERLPFRIAAYAVIDALLLLNPERPVGCELLTSVQLVPLKPPPLPPPLNWIPVPEFSNARRHPLPADPGFVVICIATTARAISVGVGIA
jgi:hypothetical protein